VSARLRSKDLTQEHKKFKYEENDLIRVFIKKKIDVVIIEYRMN
jgi:hypothetical protein